MLYQKHRPSSFDEMLGNESEIESLKQAFSKDNPPHVFLFSGETGCGKTTAARICSKLVGAGELSITEINSSNNRGIETARQIIDQCQLMPLDGTAMAFIIDEVHKTTGDWQNAMLKILEDTPSTVYFFLCTTDPQKLIPTLRKRCQTFNFNPIDPETLTRLVKRVAKKEGMSISAEIAEAIGNKSEGSARVSLQLLEKIMTMEDEEALKIINSAVSEDSAEVIDLCRALLAGKPWGEISGILKGLKETAPDAEKIRYAVMGYMSAVLLSKQNDKAAVTLEMFSEPFYNSGFPGVVLACHQVIFS